MSKIKYQKLTVFIPIILFLISPFQIFASDIVINEFQVDPSNAQWVELYNKGQQAVDISGWVIDDGGGTQKYIIGNNISLQSQKCLSFQSGNFNFNTASSDSARLIVNNEVIDTYSYSQRPGENISFGRSVDGGGNWITFSSPTRDKLNATGEVCLAPTPTLTATPVPTSSPTNTIAPSAAAKPQSTSTPIKLVSTVTKIPSLTLPSSPSATPFASSSFLTSTTQSAVLGETTNNETKEKKNTNVFSILLITLGSICVGVACILSYRQIKKSRMKS